MDGAAKKDVSQSTENALRILDCFIEKDELGISELSRTLGLGKASVSRLVAALENRKFLKQNVRTGKYRLGIRLMLFGSLFQERNDLARAFSGVMTSLAAKYQATAHLSCINGTDMLVVNKVSAGPLVYMQSRIGGTMTAYASATGKCVLAFSATEQLEKFLENVNFIELTEHTITDKAEFLAQLNAIKRNGYALDDEESTIGLYCVGVPILDMSGNPIAAMSISGSKTMLQGRTDEIISDLKIAVSQSEI